MSATRRYFSPEQKVAALRRHLLEKVPVSDLCDELQIAPSLFYLWQREFFENGQAAFVAKADGRVNEHNAWVPRDHWLEPAEQQAILDFHGRFPLEGYRRLTFMML